MTGKVESFATAGAEHLQREQRKGEFKQSHVSVLFAPRGGPQKLVTHTMLSFLRVLETWGVASLLVHAFVWRTKAMGMQMMDALDTKLCFILIR